MSVRKYLSELSGEHLIKLLDASNETEDEQAQNVGTTSVRTLTIDLHQQYPGLLDVAEHILNQMEESGAPREFAAGVWAGSLLMIQAIRLAAERDELDGIVDPQTD